MMEMNKAFTNGWRCTQNRCAALELVTRRECDKLKVDFSFLTGSSVLFYAFYHPAETASVEALKREAEAKEFVNEAHKHCKTISASGSGVGFVAQALGEKFSESNTTGNLVSAVEGVVTSRGAVTANFSSEFIKAIAQHRHWEREKAWNSLTQNLRQVARDCRSPLAFSARPGVIRAFPRTLTNKAGEVRTSPLSGRSRDYNPNQNQNAVANQEPSRLIMPSPRNYAIAEHHTVPSTTPSASTTPSRGLCRANHDAAPTIIPSRVPHPANHDAVARIRHRQP